MSPVACPNCLEYAYLIKPNVAEIARDSLVACKDIQCENCGWVGEADELDETDSDG